MLWRRESCHCLFTVQAFGGLAWPHSATFLCSFLLAFSPQSDMCPHLMATFLKPQYQYHVFLYRECFLRDYDGGTGQYYSDLSMCAIYAIDALAGKGIAVRELSNVFSNQSHKLLYGTALESPNDTTLQALIPLGHRQIGHRKTSKA